MKKLTALLLVLLMVMSLSVTAFADDGSQTTTVTVVVPAATYTATVPEDVSFDLNVVTAATATETGRNDNNYIGEATVSDVANCRFIQCHITAPTLKNGSDTLNSSVSCQALDVGLGSEPGILNETINNGNQKAYFVYERGRQGSGGLDSEIFGVQCWLQIDETAGAAAVAGDYVGTMTFTFETVANVV